MRTLYGRGKWEGDKGVSIHMMGGDTEGARAQDDYDRRDLFDGPPHSIEPWKQNGGPSRLIGHAKDGMNAKHLAVNDAYGRPIGF